MIDTLKESFVKDVIFQLLWHTPLDSHDYFMSILSRAFDKPFKEIKEIWEARR